MKIKPIILITGEPKSIFFEIFFKALKKNEYKSPLVLICCKETLLQEMKKNKFKKRIKLLNSNEIKNTIIDNRTLNIINIKLQKSKIQKLNYKLKKKYIENSFNVAFKLIKDGYTHKFINGPINKSSFLNKKY